MKHQSCLSSGNKCREGETGDEERGRERYNRSSSTVIGVLLQGQNRKRFHLVFLPQLMIDKKKVRFSWKILFAAGHRFYNAGHSWGNQWETDLGVVGMAGLGAPANLLGPHPVTLHWGIMYNGVKEQQQEQEKLLLKSHLNFNIQKLWTANDIFHKCTIANTHWASEFEWVGRAWCLIKTQL